MENLYRVAIVVDSAFGARLFDLSKRLHVWVCSSPGNGEAIKEIWSKNGKEYSLKSGVTSFKVKEGASPQEMFLGVIDNVDLHHGQYSHVPAWSVLEVYGVKPLAMIKAKLEEYGQGSFEETEWGFTFTRKLDSSSKSSERS